MLQAIEIGLWMWSLAFYIYPAIVLSIIFSGTVLSSNAIYQQRKKLAAPFSESHIVPIVRKGYVHAASSRQLVPGDVIVLQQGAALCDMVLLRGSCLVDESKLTGEVRCFSTQLLGSLSKCCKALIF